MTTNLTNLTKQRDTHIGAIAIHDVNPEEITGGLRDGFVRLDLGPSVVNSAAHLFIRGRNSAEQVDNLRGIARVLMGLANEVEARDRSI